MMMFCSRNKPAVNLDKSIPWNSSDRHRMSEAIE